MGRWAGDCLFKRPRTYQHNYDAFGNVTNGLGSWQGPFGYAGGFGYQEDASGLNLLGHRYYDSFTGQVPHDGPGQGWPKLVRVLLKQSCRRRRSFGPFADRYRGTQQWLWARMAVDSRRGGSDRCNPRVGTSPWPHP
jgi:hypothetical protein